MAVLALEHIYIDAHFFGLVCQSNALDVRANRLVSSLLLQMQLILAHGRDILLGHSLLPIARLRIARW